MINLNKLVLSQRKEFEDYYKGLKTILEGLVNTDIRQIIEGLDILLTYHDKNFAGSRMPYEIISIDATVLVKIAREKGMIIGPEDIKKGLGKYIPWNLFE